MATPFDAALIATLESLLAPGGRARLSNYVEAAQCEILCGRIPDVQRHHESIHTILHAADARIAQLAQVWAKFAGGGKQFTGSNYTAPDFLDAYLAYYCTTNVAKVQLSLLDLVARAALVGPTLHVIDVGVGTGTTLLGLMDFLLAWATVCDLYNVPFPIEAVTFTGLDCTKQNLQYAQRVAMAYAGALARRRALITDAVAQARLEAMEQWVATAQWQQHDLNETPYPGEVGNLVIASNVFNELLWSGRDNLEHLLTAMPMGGVGIIIEPGAKANASQLMGWRRTLVDRSRALITIGPCGIEPGPPMGIACDSCWNGRRESLHQPALYKRFRAHADKVQQDRRSFEDYENQLLSWSYVLLQATPPTPVISISPITLAHQDIWPATQPLTFIGAFRARVDTRDVQLDHFEPDTASVDRDYWTDFVRFCPTAVANVHNLSLLRDHGIQLPRLRYGETIALTNTTYYPVRSRVARIEPGSETSVERTHAPPSIAATFLPTYTPQVRRAVDEIAYRLFGFQGMRPFQHQILGQSLTGHSILGIAATGGGKSECYILPAMLLPGLTVVISPLKSLMMDQYEQRICQRYGLGNVTTIINGDVPFAERQQRLRRIELGHYKLVYVTPEQIERSYVLDSLRRADQLVGIRYLALDEAHCISQWGHDFRSSYLNLIHRLQSRHIRPVRIALTATASPEVRRDICEELQLDPRPLEDGGNLFIESSNRPELNLVVRVCRTTDEKVDNILADLQDLVAYNQHNQSPGAAIVFMPYTGGKLEYTANERGPTHGKRSPGASSFASYLERTLQERVAIYHGKMNDDGGEAGPDVEPEEELDVSAESHWEPPFGNLSGRRRQHEQRAFIAGQRTIMVATKGFGMGIDKPNIRYVIHRSAPGNLEAYAQEAGRAGRDGEPATVILYYSPDSPLEESEWKQQQLPSDDEIQRRFLDGKYIRREDVLVMRAFLRAVQRKIVGRLYVTNDEALDFFHRCIDYPHLAGLSTSYQWPAWPERESEGRESDVHQRILDCGYHYQQATNYLKRILDILYRIRPAVGADSPREALVQEYRQVGAHLIRPYVQDATAILDSNAYFGTVLREAGFTAPELKKLLTKGDLLELAVRLNQPLSEVAQLIGDIKNLQLAASGSRRDHLIEYVASVAPCYGPAEGRENLEDWRDYAGARRRAKKGLAEDRARKAGRQANGRYQETTLDDWFSWGEMNTRQGWEIFPGPALARDQDFSAYLDAFMALHDSRQRNDQAAYLRLLTDYVGVKADGQIRTQGGKLCLRAVLLGYLKTYEVIVGTSCLSCSRCVPDEHFTASLEERKQVVARMSAELERLFGDVERCATHIPDPTLVAALLTTVRREQGSGRSLVAYLQGWTNRVLLDTPTHRGVLVVRATMMIDGLIEVQRDDLLALLQNVVQLAADDEVDAVTALVEQAWRAQPRSVTICRQRITLAQRQAHAVAEAQAWEDLLGLVAQQKRVPQANVHEACAALTKLYAPDAPLDDPSRHAQYALRAARTASERRVAEVFYQRTIPARQWAEVAALVGEAYQVAWPGLEAPLLLRLWLAGDLHVRAIPVVAALAQETPCWTDWPAEEIQALVQMLPDAVLMHESALTVQFINHLAAPVDRLRLGRIAHAAEAAMNADHAQMLATAALQSTPVDLAFLVALGQTDTLRGAVYQALRSHFHLETGDAATWLLTHFNTELLTDTPDERLRRLTEAVHILPADEYRQAAARQLQPLAMPLLSEPNHAAQAHLLWQQACLGCTSLSIDYLFQSQRQPETAPHALELLGLLAKRDQATRIAIYRTLKGQDTITTWRALQIWLAWFTPEICAEPPMDRVHLVDTWGALLTVDAPSSPIITALSPLIMPLFDDRVVGGAAHGVWQRLCSTMPNAIAAYVSACDAMQTRAPAVSRFLNALRRQQPATHHAVYLKLKPAAFQGGSTTTFQRWCGRFGRELRAEALGQRLSVLQHAIDLLLAEGEPATIPAWLHTQAAKLIGEPIPTAWHAARQAEAQRSGAAARSYALLCAIIPEERIQLADLIRSLEPRQREIRQMVYRMERLVGPPANWEALVAWIPQWIHEIGSDGVDVQIQIIDHALPLVPTDERRSTALALLSAPLRILLHHADHRVEEVIARLQAQIPDLVDLVYRSEDLSIIMSNPHLLNVWLRRYQPRILAEPPAQRLSLLAHSLAALPKQYALRVPIAEQLQPIAHSLLTATDLAVVAEAQRLWQTVCAQIPALTTPYIAAIQAMPSEPQRTFVCDHLPTTRLWLQALYPILRPAFSPQSWEDLVVWLDRFATIEATLPDEERLALFRLSVTLLRERDTPQQIAGVARLQVTAQTLCGIPAIAAQAHQLWQECLQAKPKAAWAYLTNCSTTQDGAVIANSYAAWLAEHAPQTWQIIYAYLQPRFVKLDTSDDLLRTARWFAPFIRADASLRDGIVLRAITLAQRAERTRLYQTAWFQQLVAHLYEGERATEDGQTQTQAPSEVTVIQCIANLALRLTNEHEGANIAQQTWQAWVTIDLSLLPTLVEVFQAQDARANLDWILDHLLNRKCMLRIAEVPPCPASPRWQQARQMVTALIPLQQLGPLTTGRLPDRYFEALDTCFRPWADAEQADMLVAVLAQIRTWTTPSFLTPLARHVEAFVAGGRVAAAHQLAATRTGLMLGRRKEPLEAFLRNVAVTVDDARQINPDYARIAAQLLGTGPQSGR